MSIERGSTMTGRERTLRAIRFEPTDRIPVVGGFVRHSDGNIMPIVPDLLDAGVDGFQGLQETIETKIDVAALRAMRTRAGLPPVIVGSVSSVTTLPFGTPEDVRADVRRCRELATSQGGGWLLNFSSSLGPEVPSENIRAFFDEAVRGTS